jgi:hypothetical protein
MSTLASFPGRDRAATGRLPRGQTRAVTPAEVMVELSIRSAPADRNNQSHNTRTASVPRPRPRSSGRNTAIDRKRQAGAASSDQAPRRSRSLRSAGLRWRRWLTRNVLDPEGRAPLLPRFQRASNRAKLGWLNTKDVGDGLRRSLFLLAGSTTHVDAGAVLGQPTCTGCRVLRIYLLQVARLG